MKRNVAIKKDESSIIRTSSERMHNRKAHRTKVVVLHRSLPSQSGKILLFILTLFLVSALAFSFPESVLRYRVMTIDGFELGLTVPILAIIPLAIIGSIVFCTFNTRYIFDTSSIRIATGIFSTQLSNTEVFFKNIRTIEVDQSMLDRLFNTGDIKILAGSSHKSNLTLKGILYPYQYLRLIERRIEKGKVSMKKDA